MRRLAVFDGHYFLHRTLHLESFAQMEYGGVRTGGVRGVLQAMREGLDAFVANTACCVFDSGLSRRRLSLYPEYKAHRRATDTEEDRAYRELFRDQLPRLIAALPLVGVRPIVLKGREGDDVIAAVCDVAEGTYADQVTVISDDRDLLQLVSPTVSVFRPATKGFVNEANFERILGYKQDYHVLAKAIVGDPSDNIAGVAGVGKKTVEEVFHDYPIAEGLGLKTFCAGHESKRARKIADSWDVVERNVALLDLRREKFDQDSYRAIDSCLSAPSKLNRQEFLKYCRQYGFESVMEMYSWWTQPFDRLR